MYLVTTMESTPILPPKSDDATTVSNPVVETVDNKIEPEIKEQENKDEMKDAIQRRIETLLQNIYVHIDRPNMRDEKDLPDIIIFQCPCCPNSFTSEMSLSDHFFIAHENGGIDERDERQHDYKCKVCDQTFGLRSQLEIHFENTHNTYQEFRELDVYNGGGFPGWDVLEKINMVRRTEKTEKECFICTEEYSEDLIPLNLICCNRNICYLCLKKHIQTINQVRCPYCDKDYETLTEPVTFVDEIDEVDFSKWKDWWVRHVDIFF
jgi:hypothetical protein